MISRASGYSTSPTASTSFWGISVPDAKHAEFVGFSGLVKRPCRSGFGALGGAQRRGLSGSVRQEFVAPSRAGPNQATETQSHSEKGSIDEAATASSGHLVFRVSDTSYIEFGRRSVPLS